MAAARAARLYAESRRRVLLVFANIWNMFSWGVRVGSLGCINLSPVDLGRTVAADLSQLLKTLVHVHGCQMLLDGLYNADPHPGNVLVLPDGRLGLIDYGMVGKLTEQERKTVAQVVLALSCEDKEEVT